MQSKQETRGNLCTELGSSVLELNWFRVFSVEKITGIQIRFENGQTFSCVQTDATTPNIVGPTMLEVVASVCTQLKFWPVKKSRIERFQMTSQRSC